MPYSGDTYSLPAGTVGVSGALANVAHVNERFSDLEAAQNAVRPITSGGTGETSKAAFLGANLVSWSAFDPSSVAITGGTITGITEFTPGAGDVDLSAATVTLPDTVSGGLDSFMALLKAASGVGQVVGVGPGVGAGLVVPGTGSQTWFIFALKISATGTVVSNAAGWFAGGTGIDGGTGGQQWIGFAVRTT